MKVTHVIIGLNVGGAENSLKNLVESHDGNTNYLHSVISLTDIGEVGRQLQNLGVEVQALGMRTPFDLPRVLWQLTRLIHATQPNIVQTWMYHADLLGGLAARLAGNRHLVWGVRTTDVGARGWNATVLVRRICSWLSHWIPDTIVCAAEASRQFHTALGYDVTRLEVVPNGFDLSRLTATTKQRQGLRAEINFQDTVLVVGSMGRFNPIKDQENFVQAAGILAQRHAHLRFLMVGRDLDYSNPVLARWISETGYADRFVLLGERPDVAICLSAMDVFCLHSRTEGFPNVLGEAMAIGLPCVATDVGDASLLLGEWGVLVPKEDSTALARGIESVLAMSPAERALLGEKAKRRIEGEFTLIRTRQRFEVIYHKVLNRNVS